ncbi:MAG: CpsD/CapB family tyrosine-protein kinase [Clostridia bacterium]|nr:CpsD/CapB family tyrosine-protein kinase [Clostridia bacterium]
MNHLQITRFPEADYVTAEGLNTLVTNLSYCGDDIRRIMITSRYAGEGKSYVTMNLMRTMAGIGRRVVLVDTDLRASGIQANYRLRPDKERLDGLTEYLSGHCEIEDVLYETNIPNAWMIPAGHEAPNPLQLLEKDKMRLLIDKLSAEFDIVLLDTPPVGILADAVALAKYCDGTLLIVAYRQGRQKEIGDAVENIRQTGCRVLGAVLNEVRFKNLSNRHYYYNSKRYSSYYSKRYGKSTMKSTKKDSKNR